MIKEIKRFIHEIFLYFMIIGCVLILTYTNNIFIRYMFLCIIGWSIYVLITGYKK